MTPIPGNAFDAVHSYLPLQGWRLQIGADFFASFSEVGGLSRGVKTISRVDGGSGVTYNFTDDVLTFGDLTFKRQRDPADPLDAKISDFLAQAIASSQKFSGQLVKLMHGEEVFKITFYGLLFTNETHPNYSKGATAGYDITYAAKVDYWEEEVAS